MFRLQPYPLTGSNNTILILSVNKERRAILFYDGDCGLCSRSVRFLMNRDQHAFLFYAPIQGELAAELLDPELCKTLSTAIYRNPEGLIRLCSDAVLHALIDIRSGWGYLARLALIVPRAWRDGVYNWVANHRHKFFSKESCSLPSPEESRQLLS